MRVSRAELGPGFWEKFQRWLYDGTTMEHVLPQESSLVGSGILGSPISLVTLTQSPVQS